MYLGGPCPMCGSYELCEDCMAQMDKIDISSGEDVCLALQKGCLKKESVTTANECAPSGFARESRFPLALIPMLEPTHINLDAPE